MVELMRTGGYSGQVDLNRILGQSKMANITSLVVKLIDDSFLDENGKIKNDLKFNINNPTFKIQNSKFLKNPDDKYDTMLFLPEGEDRKGEGGLRTKGYFKFSYKKVDDKWFICDFYGNIIKEAPENIQQKIKDYINSLDENQNINDLPLITVITVVFNGAKTLEETIQSVINQTYPNVEYIIIDGGSTDGTLDIIKKYEYYIDYWVSEKDKGIYDAMNKGVEIANGKWINFMNAGDKFYNKKTLEEVGIYRIDNNSSNKIGVLYGFTYAIGQSDKFIFKNSKIKILLGIPLYMPNYHQSMFFNINAFKKIGLYDTTYLTAADYDFLVKVFLYKLEFYCVNKIVSIYDLTGISQSKYKFTLLEYRKIRKKYIKFISDFIYYVEVLKFNIKKCVPNWTIYLIRKILRKKFILISNR
jgi:glycosyltransferase involved in cell wall biosynthesis